MNIMIRLRKIELIGLALLLMIVFLLISCSSARTIRNSYVQANAEDQHISKVYFIRTKPYKYKGLSDSRISVDINGEPLLRIDEGAYTMLKIKPVTATITTRSRTQFTNKTQPIDVSRSREYRFIAGKTYFINLDRINEEFRGIYYDPAPVSLEKAKTLVQRLRAIGGARKEPIGKIQKVADTPKAGTLKPALPENLYPGKPYLIKGNPEYVAPKPPEGKNEITFDQPPEPSPNTK